MPASTSAFLQPCLRGLPWVGGCRDQGSCQALTPAALALSSYLPLQGLAARGFRLPHPQCDLIPLASKNSLCLESGTPPRPPPGPPAGCHRELGLSSLLTGGQGSW